MFHFAIYDTSIYDNPGTDKQCFDMKPCDSNSLCWLINYCFKIVCWGPQFLFCCKCVVDVFMQRLHTFQWCLNSFLFLKQQKRFSPKSFLLYSANTHRVTKSKIFFLGYWGRFSWYRRTQKCKGNVGNDCAGRLVVNISPI